MRREAAEVGADEAWGDQLFRGMAAAEPLCGAVADGWIPA
jgi:hypothetical protein